MALLFFNIDFDEVKIEGERRATPAGAAGQVRPHRRKATRRLTARPAESVPSVAEINTNI